MSVINPLWIAAMRRQWPLAGAIVVFLLFLLVHVAFFRPTADRYQNAMRRAQELGVAFEPTASVEVMPPRVYAAIAENAMPAAKAKDEGDSGALSASLVETVSRLAARRGMDVIVTEPAPTTQQPQSVVVRAHMRVRASYSDFVAFLADLAAQEHLLAVDRFTLQPAGGGEQLVDLYVSRYVLKQAPVKP
jgi:hypothetical protein